MELKPALPFQFCGGLLLSLPAPAKNAATIPIGVAREATISFKRSELEQAIPPELRLGSALWSHAPPVNAA